MQIYIRSERKEKEDQGRLLTQEEKENAKTIPESRKASSNNLVQRIHCRFPTLYVYEFAYVQYFANYTR